MRTVAQYALGIPVTDIGYGDVPLGRGGTVHSKMFRMLLAENLQFFFLRCANAQDRCEVITALPRS